jgi:hypothetical protein
MTKWVGAFFFHTWHPTKISASNLGVAFRTLGYGPLAALRAAGRIVGRIGLEAMVNDVAAQANMLGVIFQFRLITAFIVVAHRDRTPIVTEISIANLKRRCYGPLVTVPVDSPAYVATIADAVADARRMVERIE